MRRMIDLRSLVRVRLGGALSVRPLAARHVIELPEVTLGEDVPQLAHLTPQLRFVGVLQTSTWHVPPCGA